ncbi:MAG: 50S ribosomal protein L13 [Dehalococcoidales bacterium]|jgi:large subunit ribosomal protein L13|nr:50S ribosomal protein L13 [Dehalococcoidales bacterium]
MKTYTVKAKEIKRETRVIDADGMVLGKLATQVAEILMGKDKATYTRYMDTGDRVVVINAAKVVVTGSKLTQKTYIHHSNYPGGFKEISLRDLLEKKPEEVIKKAVRGMIPRGTLGDSMMKKLTVYAADGNVKVEKEA